MNERVITMSNDFGRYTNISTRQYNTHMTTFFATDWIKLEEALNHSWILGVFQERSGICKT